VGLDTPPRATLYWPVAQVPNSFMTLLVKSAGRPEDMAGPVRQAIASLDPGLPVAKVMPLGDVVSASIARPRVVFLVIGAFAATAVLLAALGLFGVLSLSVRQRLPEMGVRLALGARPRDVAGLVMREGLTVAAAGAAFGLACWRACCSRRARATRWPSPAWSPWWPRSASPPPGSPPAAPAASTRPRHSERSSPRRRPASAALGGRPIGRASFG
jgi:hypothetical protein